MTSSLPHACASSRLLAMLLQLMIGTVIQQAGAGRRVGKSDSPQKLRPVVAPMLIDGPHRAAAVGSEQPSETSPCRRGRLLSSPRSVTAPPS